MRKHIGFAALVAASAACLQLSSAAFAQNDRIAENSAAVETQPSPLPDGTAARALPETPKTDYPGTTGEIRSNLKQHRFDMNQWRQIPDPNWGVPSTGIYPLPGSTLETAPERVRE